MLRENKLTSVLNIIQHYLFINNNQSFLSVTIYIYIYLNKKYVLPLDKEL